jgi:hypothetical protein
MIEDEILSEMKQEQADRLEEPYLFPKEEMDSLIKWRPVSNIPVDEIYKDLPEVKQYHENYVSLWNLKTR